METHPAIYSLKYKKEIADGEGDYKKFFEILTLTAENIVRIAMIRISLKKCF